MTPIILLILVMLTCSFIIVHHLYKIKDSLDEKLKESNLYQNHTSQSIDRIEQSLYQIDAIVSDIEDKIDDNRTKFICKIDDKIVELYNTEVNIIKPAIDNDGKPQLMVNYYDVEYCINTTMFCDSIEIEKWWRGFALQSNHKYDEKSFKKTVEWADEQIKEWFYLLGIDIINL